MGRNPVRVSLLLQTSTSISDLHDNGSFCFSTVVPKHLLNNTPGQHAENGQISTGIDFSSRHCDLPPIESSACTEFIGASSGTISENRILRMVIDSIKMKVPLTQEKLAKLMSQCEQVAGSKEIKVMDLTKLIGKLGLTA